VALVHSSAPQWVALDFAEPVEAHTVRVSLSLLDVKPADFAVHAIEVHYRSFGGR
jgi:hypothetical protein